MCCEARDRASRNAKPGVHFYGVKLVHISWPDADDLLSNAMEFDNEVAGPWPLGLRACLQVRPASATACAMACATGVKTGDICVNLGLNFFEKNNHDGFMMDS